MPNLFNGIFDNTTTIMLPQFMICIVAVLVAGIVLSLGYMYKTQYTKSFVTTLAMLPAMVCVVIMLVNGNIGAGVAVAGAFSLIRFRSVAGSAKEIGAIFIAMCIGLLAGMGYVGYAMLFTVIMCAMLIIYNSFDWGVNKNRATYRTLRVTIPENLNYTDIFEDIFEKYASQCELMNVKTTNMGSLFKLTYKLRLRDSKQEKNMIDDMRCRNGNLEIMISSQDIVMDEL